MSERPILFSGPMVRAILDGRKTETRRVVKEDIDIGIAEVAGYHMGTTDTPPVDVRITTSRGCYRHMDPRSFCEEYCPYGVPGERLWARETFRLPECIDNLSPKNAGRVPLRYEADGVARDCDLAVDVAPWGRVRQSIFMPRWASRITLEITGVRVERLQEVTESDARAEGFPIGPEEGIVAAVFGLDCPAKMGFGETWDSINAKRGFAWKSNPWVWVIEFRPTMTIRGSKKG